MTTELDIKSLQRLEFASFSTGNNRTCFLIVCYLREVKAPTIAGFIEYMAKCNDTEIVDGASMFYPKGYFNSYLEKFGSLDNIDETIDSLADAHLFSDSTADEVVNRIIKNNRHSVFDCSTIKENLLWAYDFFKCDDINIDTIDNLLGVN